jgi:sugar lactone lactonase YvrE
MRILRWFAALAVACVFPALTPAQVLTMDLAGQLVNFNPTTSTATPLGASLAQPLGSTLGPDGLLYVANSATNSIDRYNPATGAFVGNAVPSSTLGAGFQPAGLKFHNGELYISNQVSFPTATPGSGGVFKYNFGSGTLSPVVTGLTQPNGLLFVGNDLYIAELNNYTGRVLRYDFNNPVSTFIANGVGGLAAATALAIGPGGDLYLTDVLGQAVRRYNLANPTINSTFASGTGFNSPVDLAFYNGGLYVANFGSGGSPDGFLSRFDATSGAFVANAVVGLFGGSSVVAVPEPASLTLAGLAAGGWWLRRRNRR